MIPKLEIPLEQVQAKYRVRLGAHVAIGIGWLVYGVSILWTDFTPNPDAWYLVAGFLVFGIADLIVWRCPNCGRSFGRTLFRRECDRCLVTFDNR
jgi:hypothetical protein